MSTRDVVVIILNKNAYNHILDKYELNNYKNPNDSPTIHKSRIKKYS